MISTAKHLYRTYKHNQRDTNNSSKRSPHWHSVEKHWLEKQSQCQACGSSENLNVHHKVPFHINPELELEESNFITLCMSKDKHCHLLVGHGGSYVCWQEQVEHLAGQLQAAYANKDFKKVDLIIKEAKSTRKGP